MFKTTFIRSFVVLWLLLSAVAMHAQQPTSQVVAFNGTIPGQADGPVALRFRLYNVDTGGTILFEETQTVTVTAEKFTVRIGDATVGGIPALVFRNNPSVWIAFALDVTPDVEIGSRTAITSGGYAHAAQSLAGPVVTTLNALSNDVTLAGSPPITITPGESTLTIGAPGVLTRVAHDSNLSGDGTGGAPLGVAVPLFLSSTRFGGTIIGENTSGPGVFGTNTNGIGVWGRSTSNNGVYGESSSGIGVWGESMGTSAGADGVHGVAHGPASGVAGVNTSLDLGVGVWGESLGRGLGVYGTGYVGVRGVSNSNGVAGVWGTSSSGSGVAGEATNGDGVQGVSNSGRGVFGASTSGHAGYFQGKVIVTALGTGGGSATLCRNGSNEIATCGSSLRYKTDVSPFLGGLDIVNRLRPIAFTWKQGGMRGIGLAAEEVEKVEPLLTFRNDKGEIEGVKYNELSAVFVNAFAEQQAQIKRQHELVAQQQSQIEALQTANAEMREKVAALEKLVERNR